jgi:hypothetical protein
MITVVQGRPGMGKSVFLVSEIFRYLARGHKVYSNVEVHFDVDDSRQARFRYITSLEDIVGLREGKIVLDEVQTYLNSRNWDKLDTRFQLLLQQHRKRGLDILGATQSIKRADVVFRELVQVFYEIRKIFTLSVRAFGFGFFYIREFDPDSMESGTRSYDVIGMPRLFFADPFTLRMYDTTQEYHLDYGIGAHEIHEYLIEEKPVISRRLLSKKIVT